MVETLSGQNTSSSYDTGPDTSNASDEPYYVSGGSCWFDDLCLETDIDTDSWCEIMTWEDDSLNIEYSSSYCPPDSVGACTFSHIIGGYTYHTTATIYYYAPNYSYGDVVELCYEADGSLL